MINVAQLATVLLKFAKYSQEFFFRHLIKFYDSTQTLSDDKQTRSDKIAHLLKRDSVYQQIFSTSGRPPAASQETCSSSVQ